MEYMSCPEAAKKWGISERRVQILCSENRIPGVSKLGYMWLIPKNAEKPFDMRKKQHKMQIQYIDWRKYMDKTEKIVSAIPSAAELEQLAELHKAMGDHTRMRILWHLTQKEYCVSDLAKEIGVTESALSHQLRALRIVRLVRSRKEGKKVIYSLQDEHIGWVLEETYAHISER